MYVDRGDPAAFDFDNGDFTDDGAWHPLDLSALIPVAAKAILFEVEFTSVNAGKEIMFRRFGHSNDVNHADVETLVGNRHQSFSGVVGVGAGRKIDYKIDNATWSELNFTICGWWY